MSRDVNSEMDGTDNSGDHQVDEEEPEEEVGIFSIENRSQNCLL